MQFSFLRGRIPSHPERKDMLEKSVLRHRKNRILVYYNIQDLTFSEEILAFDKLILQNDFRRNVVTEKNRASKRLKKHCYV